MLKEWIKAGCAFLRAAWVEDRALGALSRRPHLEVLEDRTAPAVVAWQGPPLPAKPADKADWSTNPPWVGAKPPAAADTALFNQAVSSPVLSKAVTIDKLVVRSLGGANAAAYSSAKAASQTA